MKNNAVIVWRATLIILIIYHLAHVYRVIPTAWLAKDRNKLIAFNAPIKIKWYQRPQICVNASTTI
jgi:hypothetical protein